ISIEAIPHAATTARCPQSNPAPVVAGSNAVRKASKNGRIGKIEAKVRTLSGISVSGTNTPERKYSGRTVKLVIGGAACSFGMTMLSASPIEQNEKVPTIRV